MEVISGIFVLAIYFLVFLFILITSLVSSVFYGLAIGAIPLICGFFCKKKGLGWIGLAVCFALYWLHGLFLAQIASAIFVVCILKSRKKEIAE